MKVFVVLSVPQTKCGSSPALPDCNYCICGQGCEEAQKAKTLRVAALKVS
jgi:hypothetical protein